MLSDDTSFMNFQLRTTEQHCVEIWVTFWRWLTFQVNEINMVLFIIDLDVIGNVFADYATTCG